MKRDGLTGNVKLLLAQEKGLTAIELAVVVAILAILAALVAVGVTGMNRSARDAALTTDSAEAQKAIDRWAGEQPASRYPVATPVIVDGTGAVVAAATPASNGLPLPGSGLFTRLVFSDSFTNPEGVSKSFVPDYLPRLPKFGGDGSAPVGIDEKGAVKVLPTPTPTPTPTVTPTPTNTPTPTSTPTPTPTVQPTSTLTILGTVPIPAEPRLIASDGSTHRAYVAVGNSYTPSTYQVSVISGTSDIADIPVGTGDYSTGPTWVGVNETTHRVYVNHTGSNFANAINADTNAVIGTISTGLYPEGIVANPLTNRLYIANTNSGNVSVFDTTNDANTPVTTIGIPGAGAGITDLGLAIIPATNRIFVSASGLNKIFVIDGGSNTVVQTFSLTWLSYSGNMIANATSNRLYVSTGSTGGAGVVTVLDATTGATITTVTVGSNSVYWLAVNTTLNHIYATATNSSLLSVIDGASNSVIGTTDIGATGQTIAADAVNGNVYVTTAVKTVVVLND